MQNVAKCCKIGEFREIYYLSKSFAKINSCTYDYIGNSSNKLN